MYNKNINYIRDLIYCKKHRGYKMFYIIWFGFWTIVGLGVSSDATRRGKSSVLVFFLILISGPIGLINWLLFRPEN